MAVDGLPSRVTKRHASIRDAMREVAIGTAYRKEATVVRSCSTASGSTLSLPGESSRPAGQTRRVSQHPAREHSALVSDSKHGSASSRGQQGQAAAGLRCRSAMQTLRVHVHVRVLPLWPAHVVKSDDALDVVPRCIAAAVANGARDGAASIDLEIASDVVSAVASDVISVLQPCAI